jgi:TatD DNase family protein
MRYFDAHTHVQFAAFKDDFDAVIRRAREARVFLVNVGTQRDTSKAAVHLARAYEGVYAAVGLHPIHTSKSYHDPKELGAGGEGFTSRGEEFDLAHYTPLAADKKTVAIGECGLDYYHVSLQQVKVRQREAFIQQIRFARDVRKPLMIHCREAFPDAIAVLQEYKSLLREEDPGIFHFFTGTEEDARALLELGFSFTFGGVVTFTKYYHDVVKLLPFDRILSETDAPYVTPEPHRKDRNEPVYVEHVVRKLAKLRGVEESVMAKITFDNACRVFGLDL